MKRHQKYIKTQVADLLTLFYTSRSSVSAAPAAGGASLTGRLPCPSSAGPVQSALLVISEDSLALGAERAEPASGGADPRCRAAGGAAGGGVSAEPLGRRCRRAALPTGAGAGAAERAEGGGAADPG